MDDPQRPPSRERVLLRRLARMARMGAWEFDADSTGLVWTAPMYDLYEVDAAAFVPTLERAASFHPPPARATFETAVRRALATGEGWDLELPLTTAHGAVLWVRSTGEAELRDGRCASLVGTLEDVTAARRERDALRARIAESRKLAAVAEHTSSAVAIAGADGRIQWVNASFTRVTGYGLPDAVGQRPDALLATAGATAGGRRDEPPARGAETRFRRRDGRHYWAEVEIRPVHDEHGEVAAVVHIHDDVTERHEAARRQAETAERLHLAAEAGGIGIWERNLTTGEARWDPHMFRLFGLDPGAAPPTPEQLLERVHPDDRERYAHCRANYPDATGTVEIEFRVIRPDAAEAILLSRGQTSRAQDGHDKRAIGTLMDVTARRRAEQELHDALERVRLMSVAVGLGTWERDLRTGAVHWDAPMYALFGTPPEHGPLSHDQIDAMMPPAAVAKARADWERALRTGAAIEVALPILRPDGQSRFLLSRGTVLRDVAGRPARASGFVLDLTGQRRTEEQLLRATEQLELATETAKLGVWSWDIARDEVIVDARIRELLAAPDDWRPSFEDWIAAVHPADAEPVRHTFELALASGQTCGSSEHRVVRSYGEIRHVFENFVIERDANGQPRHLLGTTLDISGIRQAQSERGRLAERLQLATGAAGMAVWQMDAAGTLLADDLLARLHGIEPRPPETLWAALEAAIHPDDLPGLREAAYRARQTAAPFAFEYRLAGAAGAVRHLAVRGHGLRDETGNVSHLLGVTWDVTERHRAEAALRAKDSAERASRAKTEFLSRMSHELRTPLNAILGFAQVLELDPAQPLSDTQRERVGQIATAGWHLLDLINDVLDLSRIEAGAAPLAPAAVELEAILDECTALVGTDVARRRLRLARARQPHAPGTVWADPTRLKQVLLNLLSNAIKYNRDGGEITIVHCGDAQGNAVVAVRDTGAGLSAAQLEQLFQPFNRLGLESAPIEGTGIGLTIAQKLVEQMGGRLTVTSEPGIGSEFRVALPPAAGGPPIAEAAPPRPGGSERVLPRADVHGSLLYVEDNGSNVAVVRQLLALRPNVELITAADGAGACVLAAACQPDLILIDMRLPDTDGIALLHALRSQPETAGIACVGLSANALPPDVARALEAGFADYWTKPLEADRFLPGIDRLLAGARTA